MKYLQTETIMGDNDSAEDAVPSTQKIEMRLADLQQQLADLDEAAPLAERLQLELDSGYALLELNRFDEASTLAHTLFDRAWTQNSGSMPWRPVTSCSSPNKPIQ